MQPRRRHAASAVQSLGSAACALVGEVVGDAGERVDRGDVRAHRRRQQPRRDGEVLVVRAGEAEAVVVGPPGRPAVLPLGLRDAGPVVDDAGQHEQEVRQPVHVGEDRQVVGLEAEGDDAALGAAADRAGDVQGGAGRGAARRG